MAINNLNAGEVNPTKPPASVSQVNEKVQGGGGLLNALLLVILIGLVVFGVFFSFDKGNILNHTTQLEKDIADLNKQVADYKTQKVEVSKNASDALDKIKQNEIIWSQVITEVNKLLPQDSNGSNKVQVISYSGTESGRIALNMITQPAAVPPFNIVSALLSTFNNSVFFKNAYVPSISRGQTNSGETTLSFVLNMEYQKPETGTADINLNNTPVVDSGAKIPRSDVPANTVPVPVPTNMPKIPVNN